MTIDIDYLVKEFSELVGDKPFLTIHQLIGTNLFGSSAGVHAALKRGTIPSIKISERRTVVPRTALIKYFRDNLLGN